MNKFTFVMKRRRVERALTQRKLGQQCEIDSKLISAYERGVRLPPQHHFCRLEVALGPLPWPRGLKTPRHNRKWREGFRDHRKWRPHKDRSSSTRLKTARTAYPEPMARLARVVRRHSVWVEQAVHGSSLELLFCLLVFSLQQSLELLVRPLTWGFRRLVIVDQITGENRSDHAFPSIGLPLGNGARAVIVPQVPVRVGDGVIVVDALVGVRFGRYRIWVVLEIDGPGHCPRADELRAQYLEVIRFSEAEILAPTFPEDLVRRLRELLPELATIETKRAA